MAYQLTRVRLTLRGLLYIELTYWVTFNLLCPELNQIMLAVAQPAVKYSLSAFENPPKKVPFAAN